MTQAIVCCNQEGLVLGTDSLVLRELEGGQVERLIERKLFTIGSHAAVVSAGAAVGVELSAQLSHWLERRGLMDWDDMLALSRDFLAEGYARHLRASHTRLEARSAEYRHLCFIIGGYSGRAPSPYEAILLQSEAGELPFQETRLGRVFTLPRRTALEGRIARQIIEGLELRALAETCRASLEGIAERNPEAIAAPFQIALVTASGVEFLEEGQSVGTAE